MTACGGKPTLLVRPDEVLPDGRAPGRDCKALDSYNRVKSLFLSGCRRPMVRREEENVD